MEVIVSVAVYGDQRKELVISQPSGAGNDFHIFIDKYYEGSIVKLKGDWVGHLIPKSRLTADDVQILGEMIDKVLMR